MARRKKANVEPGSVAEMLSEHEQAFCRFYIAMDEQQFAECYRQAFADDPEEEGKSQNPKDIWKRAERLLTNPFIKRYLDELRRNETDAARHTIRQQLRFGTPTAQLKAAEKILADEEKIGTRDAAFAWAETMCNAGAELVIPFPEKASGHVACPECGHAFVAEVPIELTAPLSEMFPQFAEKSA